MGSDLRQSRLVFALRRTLRSLAQLLIRIGIRFEEFTAIAREVFVESAIRDLAHPSTPSRERIAVLTGLTRSQVDRYIDGKEGAAATDPKLATILVEVLHKWHTVPEYGGPYGIPLELEFAAPSDRCIQSLVALVDPSASPHVVLDELLRSGAILRACEKRFRPLSRFLMTPDPTSPILIERFATTLSQLAATFDYNMDPQHTDKRLERRVYADRGLPAELAPAFESYARTKTVDFLLELDNWLAAHGESEGEPGCATGRIDTGVNVFLYVEPALTRPEPLASLVSKTRTLA